MKKTAKEEPIFRTRNSFEKSNDILGERIYDQKNKQNKFLPKSVQIRDFETKKIIDDFASRGDCAEALGLTGSTISDAIRKYKKRLLEYIKNLSNEKPKRTIITPKNNFNNGKTVVAIDTSKKKFD